VQICDSIELFFKSSVSVIPYSWKFSKVLILTVFEDQLRFLKITTSIY